MEKYKIKPIFLYNSRKFVSFNSVNSPWNGMEFTCIYFVFNAVYSECVYSTPLYSLRALHGRGCWGQVQCSAISKPMEKVLLDVPKIVKYYCLLFCAFRELVTQKFALLFIDSDSLLIPLLINLSEFNAGRKQQSHSIQRTQQGRCAVCFFCKSCNQT